MRDEMKETLDTMERCLANLNTIQSSFVKTMNGVKQVGDVLKQVNRFIVGTIPPIDVCDVGLPKVELTDKEYFKKLSSVYSKRSNEERLAILIKLADTTLSSYNNYKRKSEKLEERIALTERTAPERFIAINQLKKIKESMRVFSGRLDELVGRFFKIRKAMLNGITGSTEILIEKFKDDSGNIMPWFKEQAAGYMHTETFTADNEIIVSKLKRRRA